MQTDDGKLSLLV